MSFREKARGCSYFYKLNRLEHFNCATYLRQTIFRWVSVSSPEKDHCDRRETKASPSMEGGSVREDKHQNKMWWWSWWMEKFSSIIPWTPYFRIVVESKGFMSILPLSHVLCTEELCWFVCFLVSLGICSTSSVTLPFFCRPHQPDPLLEPCVKNGLKCLPPINLPLVTKCLGKSDTQMECDPMSGRREIRMFV